MSPIASRISVLASALSNDPRIAARTARADGFAGILFDAISNALDLTALTQTGRREFRHLLSSNNLQLVGLQTQLGPDGFGPRANIERALSQLDRIMQTAADLGAPLICLDLGPLPPPPPLAHARNTLPPRPADPSRPRPRCDQRRRPPHPPRRGRRGFNELGRASARPRRLRLRRLADDRSNGAPRPPRRRNARA